MNDKQALAAACALTGDSVEAVISYRLTGHSIRFVVDRGIKGCPLFELDLDQLKPPTQPEPPVTKTEEPKPTRRRTTKK